MRVLLDTHVLLWWLQDDPRISARVRDLIADDESDVLVSVATIWEIAIKAGLGQLELPSDLQGFLRQELTDNAFSCLSVTFEHAVGVRDLPQPHRDPFDRILVVQSRLEDVPLVSHDARLTAYDVELLW